MPEGHARLTLLGPFRLLASDGARIEITSKRGCALIAMLAMSNHGERTRGWLQDRLWGSREKLQAQNSLRNELSTLRRQLNGGTQPLLRFTRDRVMLDLNQIDVDAREPLAERGPIVQAEFLEGIDIPGADGFEEWLREQRAAVAAAASRIDVADAEEPARAPVSADFHRAPSLSVLPFANQTGDPDKTYLAAGISEELIDRISRLRWVPVVSPGQTFRHDPDETIQAVGQRLKSAYVLSGVMRARDAAYFLSAQMVDTVSGQVIWSARLELPAPHASNAIEPFVTELVAVLETRIEHAEQVRARSQPETALTVNDLIWRGRWHQNRLSHDDTEAAGRYFAEALRLAPDLPSAVIEYAQHLGLMIWTRRLDSQKTSEMRALAQRAIVLDYEDARGHMLAGMAEMWLRNTVAAETLLRRAIALNPSLSMAYEQLATLQIMIGSPAAAIELMSIGFRLGPTDYRLFFKHGEIALAHLLVGDLDDALRHAEQSIILRPAYWHAHVVRINALARSGRIAEAQQACRALMLVRPRFTPHYIDWIPFTDPRWREFLRAGIALATAD